MMDKIKIGDKIFSTLVAITEDEHIKGLMFNKNPQIMSFPYDKLEIHKFWMQNTLVPLDILFCRANKIIDIQKGIPFSIELLGPDIETDLVVELPFQTVEANNIKLNDFIELKYSISTLSRKYIEKLNILT